MHKQENGERKEEKPTYSALVKNAGSSGRPWYTQRRRVLLNVYIAML
jgi:hypothetical protein